MSNTEYKVGVPALCVHGNARSPFGDNMERVVLSLGGSLLFDGYKFNTEFVKALGELLRSLPFSFGVVVGGGSVARLYAQAARSLSLNEFYADNVAILSTRQNAMLVAASVNGIYVQSFEEAQLFKRERVVVMGGTIPGITTDADSALLAEVLGAKRLVNLSTVDGVYDKNPEYPDAHKYEEMSYDQLLSLAMSSDDRSAGTHFVFDVVACAIIRRSKIETHFVNGRDLEQVERAIRGLKHAGTVVK